MGQISRVIAEPGPFEPLDESDTARVPVEESDQIRRRAAFFDYMEQVAARANLSPEEADSLAQEAVAAVRAQSEP
jgi:hypothetical protein